MHSGMPAVLYSNAILSKDCTGKEIERLNDKCLYSMHGSEFIFVLISVNTDCTVCQYMQTVGTEFEKNTNFELNCMIQFDFGDVVVDKYIFRLYTCTVR